MSKCVYIFIHIYVYVMYMCVYMYTVYVYIYTQHMQTSLAHTLPRVLSTAREGAEEKA